MIEWIKALSPIIVAVIPVLVAVFQSAKKTRKDTCKIIEEVKNNLDAHIKANEWSEQKQRRLRILRCAYEIINGVNYSNEYLSELVDDCDTYKAYCDAHPDYINSKGEVAMEIVREEYLKKLRGESK